MKQTAEEFAANLETGITAEEKRHRIAAIDEELKAMEDDLRRNVMDEGDTSDDRTPDISGILRRATRLEHERRQLAGEPEAIKPTPRPRKQKNLDQLSFF